jgi:hypothetical protein
MLMMLMMMMRVQARKKEGKLEACTSVFDDMVQASNMSDN